MSLWRKPGTRTFQLVHRSQRDPLINDPDASDRVLKEIDSKQKSRGTPASISAAYDGGASTAGEDDDDTGAGAGDAAAYGIYYDDTEYDYMQHLRSVGDAGESFLVEAPSRMGKAKASRIDKEHGGIIVRDTPSLDLPDDALPSHPLDEVSYADATSSRAQVSGLQPDLDPAVREVLEALDDDAYALNNDEGESDDEEDFFDSIMHGGELTEGRGWMLESSVGKSGSATERLARGVGELDIGKHEDGQDDSLVARVARFKAAGGKDGPGDVSDEDEFSEAGDTIAELRASSSRRPPRKAPSAAGSQFSMSSSAMFRNKGLQTLDERFDQIEKLYEDDSDEVSWGERSDEEAETEPAGELGLPREDLDRILDDFLSRYEVLGGKMRPVLEAAGDGQSRVGQLDRIRRELATLEIADQKPGEDAELASRRLEKARILAAVERQYQEEQTKKGRIRMDIDERPKERWDCETVLSTYTNVSNHPRLLRVRDRSASRPSRIRIDPKTGIPFVDDNDAAAVGAGTRAIGLDEAPEAAEDDEDDSELSDTAPRPDTVKRPRGESAAEKRARKAAVKEQRSARRAEKKTTKDAFGNETKRQKRIAGRAVADGAAADVRIGEGVRRLA